MKRTNRPKFFSPKVSLPRVLLTSALVASMAIAGASYQIGQEIKKDLEASLPPLKEYKLDRSPQTTRVSSADGKLVATLFREHQRLELESGCQEFLIPVQRETRASQV